MPKRKKIGKISTFLRQFGSQHGGQSAFRSELRNTNEIPNSTKRGAGDHVLRIRSRKQIKKAS